MTETKTTSFFSNSWAGFEAEPADFVERVRSGPIPERWLETARNRIAPFAEAMLRRATWRFEEALRQGLAEIQVQPLSPSPTTRFTALDPAQRKYFPLISKVRDDFSYAAADELDEAEGPNGEKLYSVGVVPIATASAPLPQPIDGRRKHDWDLVDPVILREHKAIKLHPKRTKIGLKRRVEAELGSRSPGSTALAARIKKIIPEF